MTCAQIDEVNAKKRLDYAEASAMEDYTQPKMTVSVIKAKVMADINVVKLAQAHTEANAYRKGMEMMHANVERDCAFISRDLTRRTSSGFSTRVSKFTT